MKLKIGLALGGGVNAPVPVSLSKQMGADIVIGASYRYQTDPSTQ